MVRVDNSAIKGCLVIFLLAITVCLMIGEANSTSPVNIKFYPCNLFTESDPTAQVSTTRHVHDHVDWEQLFKIDPFNVQLGSLATKLMGNEHRKKVERMTNDQPIRTDAECAAVPLTFDPDLDEQEHPSAKRINLFVKRFRATLGKDSKKALWLVQGGAGGSSMFLIESNHMNILSNEFDFDHRGVGRSQRATCVAAQSETYTSPGNVLIVGAEWTVCQESFQNEWGWDETKQLNSKAAAIDVAKLIQYINVPKLQIIFTYGISYGTTNDEIFRIEEFTTYCKGSHLGWSTKGKYGYGSFQSLDLYYVNFDATGQSFMCTSYSDKDDLCKKKLGQYADFTKTTSMEFMKQVLSQVYDVPIEQSSCRAIREILPDAYVRKLFGTLIMSDSQRLLIPALIYRMKRCDPKIDVGVFAEFVKKYQIMNTNPAKQVSLDSSIINQHIGTSEFWNPSSTMESIYEMESKLTFSFGGSIQFMQVIEDTNWHTYELDPLYFNHTFTTSAKTPVLLINGDLDPQTCLWSAQRQAENIEGNVNGGLVVVPFAVHGTLRSSPQSGSVYPCGMELLANFIKMDTPNVNTMDKSCIGRLLFEFAGNPELNLAVLGTADIYDGSVPVPDPNPINPTKEKTIYYFSFCIGKFIIHIHWMYCSIEYLFNQNYGKIVKTIQGC